MYSDIRRYNLFWGSSYDRGLDIVLKYWPQIKEKFPDATLQVCYGWNLFDRGYANNQERMNWKERINKQMEAEGITHHGRVGKKELKEIREKCGVWVYPTYFPEINCITALETQREGCVPCVVGLAALKETVGSGSVVSGDIYDEETQQKWLVALLELMGNEEKWLIEQKKGKDFVSNHSWSVIASKWRTHFT